jgi:hypothetical protein
MRTMFVALRFSSSLLFAAVIAAQTPSATLVGRVSDASRASVVEASIRVRDVGTNETRTARSSAEGEYTVSSLTPGTYEVTVEKPGFKMMRETALELAVGQTARLDVVLQIGAVTESVEVQATIPLLNTETSSRGDVIAPREITEMPLNGRDFNDLAFMVPGVQTAEEGGKGSPYSSTERAPTPATSRSMASTIRIPAMPAPRPGRPSNRFRSSNYRPPVIPRNTAVSPAASSPWH